MFGDLLSYGREVPVSRVCQQISINFPGKKVEFPPWSLLEITSKALISSYTFLFGDCNSFWSGFTILWMSFDIDFNILEQNRQKKII